MDSKLDFRGELLLKDAVNFSSLKKARKIKSHFQFSSSNTGLIKDNEHIFLFGKITDVFLKHIALSNYKDKQEQLIKSLYNSFNENFITYLDGYFLIIIYDTKKNSFYIFNNRYSNTFCYYYLSKNRLIFANEVQKIVDLLPAKPNVNFDVVNLFLNSGYSFSEKTYFQNISRMTPGTYMKIKNNAVIVKKYAEMQFNRKKIKPKNLTSKLNKYEKLWEHSIKKYLDANDCKEVGSTLSGGNDTAWVVLKAARMHNKPIRTYTCTYDYKLFDETKKARFVTQKTGSKFHEILVTEKDLDFLPEVIRSAEEPVLASALSLYKLIKIASKDCDVIFSGDGGNNIFHHLYPVSEIHKYINFMPYFIRKSLYEFVSFLANVTKWERFWELKHVLHAFSYKNIYPDFYKNVTSYRHFGLKERQKLFKPKFYNEFNSTLIKNGISIRKKSFDNDLVHSRFVYGVMEYVSTFQEHFAKQFNITYFAPYQNQKLMDFICSLPYSILNKGNTFQRLTNTTERMHFHKQAMRRHFSNAFVKKSGQPFDQPFHGWFEKRPEIVTLLFKRLKKRGWYSDKYLNSLYREHKKQKLHDSIFCRLENHAYRIMALLSLEIWCMEFIDSPHNTTSSKRENISLEDYLR